MTSRPFLYGVMTLVLSGQVPGIFAQESASDNSPVTVQDSIASSEQSAPPADLYGVPVESDIDPTQDQMLMQQDIMMLRGMVEELGHKLEQMRRIQEDRYLELDSRIQNLPGQEQPSSGQTTVTDSIDPTEAVESIASQDEETLYDTALELIRNRQYDLAISQLRAVINQYPDGKYTPNAYYWLGDVYMAMPEPQYEKARQALAQVITFFPDHSKVPHAAYKLGVVYNQMGNCQRATEILKQVIREQQGSSVAGLAEAHLRDKVDCDN